jgi:hypothetical protein
MLSQVAAIYWEIRGSVSQKPGISTEILNRLTVSVYSYSKNEFIIAAAYFLNIHIVTCMRDYRRGLDWRLD